tara:strand:- start:4781 stop:5140 length:360 start_codon:yes stop_codon:yes gene_type:complete
LTYIGGDVIIETMRNVNFGIFEEATAGPTINTSVDNSNAVFYSRLERGNPMTQMRKLNIGLEIGQVIAVGKNDDLAKITKIEYHQKSGEVRINTTRGPRKALSFKLCEEELANKADRYR